MKSYDLHTHPENLEETVKMAKKLGWFGLGVIIPWKGLKTLEDLKKVIKPFKETMDIVSGVEIKAKPNEIKRVVRKIRKKVELILVHGGDLKINRAVVEIPEVDILTHPESENDSGLDHVLAHLAAKNNVSIEFNFHELLYSHKHTRATIFSKFLQNAKLIRKYHTPFVLTSGALSGWDLRSPSELMAFGKILGLQPPQIRDAISDLIVKENRKRMSKKWIMPGVEIK